MSKKDFHVREETPQMGGQVIKTGGSGRGPLKLPRKNMSANEVESDIVPKKRKAGEAIHSTNKIKESSNDRTGRL